jgi:hypothetical protein
MMMLDRDGTIVRDFAAVVEDICCEIRNAGGAMASHGGLAVRVGRAIRGARGSRPSGVCCAGMAPASQDASCQYELVREALVGRW